MRFREIPPLLCHFQDIQVGYETKAAFHSYRTTLPDDRRVPLDKFEMVDIARKSVALGLTFGTHREFTAGNPNLLGGTFELKSELANNPAERNSTESAATL
jgi:hypothetical protein